MRRIHAGRTVLWLTAAVMGALAGLLLVGICDWFIDAAMR